MARRYRINIIRYFQAYSIDDISALLKVDNSTVRRWVHEEGLKPIDSKQPLLHKPVNFEIGYFVYSATIFFYIQSIYLF